MLCFNFKLYVKHLEKRKFHLGMPVSKNICLQRVNFMFWVNLGLNLVHLWAAKTCYIMEHCWNAGHAEAI